MKHIVQFTMIAAVLLAANISPAQTADQLVTEGRAFLAQRNLTNANAKFVAAVAASQNHENANALLSVTRLLNLLYLPPAQNFLTRLGVSATGRDVYHWTAFIAKDTNRVPIAPVGVSGAEASPFWHTNALPEIANSLANLARITNTNFLLNLTSNETTTAAVTVDYGDLQMLRAGLHFLEYFSYTLLAHDLDAQLTAVRALYTNDNLNIEQLLVNHPHLLAFATTNDMPAARAAFVNFVDRYADASDFLRARPAGTTRMFNFAANGSKKKEDRFRKTLADLKTSLNGAMVLSQATNFTFFAGAHFSGQGPLRSFLPQFRGHRMVLGTLGDPTFGGLLIGRGVDEVEDFILNNRKLIGGGAVVPAMRLPGAAPGQPFHFSMRARAGRGYVVQASTNLVNWENVAAFVALSGAVDFTETGGQHTRRFYRIVDQDRSMPPPDNNNFANRVTIPPTPGVAMGYNRGATTELGEPSLASGHSVWFSWTAPSTANYVARVDAKNFTPAVGVYTGTTVASLSLSGLGRYGGQAYFSAVAGMTYAVKVDSEYPFFGQNTGLDGGFKLTIGQLPTIAFTSPTNGSTFSVGSTINLQLTAADPEGTLSKVELRDSQAGLLAVLTTPPFTFAWTNAPQGNHYLTATATDSSGLTAIAFLNLAVPPANDFFTNRTVLAGAAVQTNGLFAGAGRENGEPAPYGYRGGSVWFEWTAPSNGNFVVSANSKVVGNASSFQAPLLAVYTNISYPSTNLYDTTNIYYLPTTSFGYAYTFTRLSDTSMRVVINYPGGDSETNTYVFTSASAGTYTGTYQPTAGAAQSYSGAFSNLTYGVSGPPPTGFAPTSLNGVRFTTIENSAGLYNLGVLPSAFIGFGNLPSQTPINAQAGTKYFIALGQYTYPDYDYSVAIFPALPPLVALNAPTNGSTLFTTSSIPVTASATDADGTVLEMRLYVDGVLQTNSTGASLQLTLANLSVGSHSIDAVAKDSQGAVAEAYSSFNVVTPPPPNDNFASALVITGGYYSINGLNNDGATKEAGEPNIAGHLGGKSIWWRWTAPKSGTATVSTSTGYYYYTLLGIYTGSAVNSLTAITSNYGYGSLSLSFNANSGTTYYFAVDDLNNIGGTVSLSMNQP